MEYKKEKKKGNSICLTDFRIFKVKIIELVRDESMKRSGI